MSTPSTASSSSSSIAITTSTSQDKSIIAKIRPACTSWDDQKQDELEQSFEAMRSQMLKRKQPLHSMPFDDSLGSKRFGRMLSNSYRTFRNRMRMQPGDESSMSTTGQSDWSATPPPVSFVDVESPRTSVTSNHAHVQSPLSRANDLLTKWTKAKQSRQAVLAGVQRSRSRLRCVESNLLSCPFLSLSKCRSLRLSPCMVLCLHRNVMLASERMATRRLTTRVRSQTRNSKTMRSSWFFRQRAAGRLSRHEERRQPVALLCTSPFGRWLPVLAPDSLLILTCDLVNAIAMSFVAVFTPLQAAFYAEFDSIPWHAANTVCECVFILSVVLHFRRGFNHDGVYVEDPTFIAMHYLRGNFATDFIASFPYAWLLGVRLVPAGSSSRQAGERLLPLLRVLRIAIPLLRGAGGAKTGASLTSSFGLNPGVSRVLKLMLVLVCACHWIGCIWWCVGEIEQDGLIAYGGNASVRFEDPEEGSKWGPSAWLRETQPSTNQYAHALLWGASMMTGFVPFDVMPSTLLEVLVTILALFFGLLANTVVISSTTSALQSISFKSARVVHKLETIDAYMRHKHVPALLARRINAFFEYQLSPHRAGSGGQHELGELPPSLAVELIMHTHQDLFRECPIFQLISPATSLSLVERFEAVVYIPGDIVIHEGASNASLYVINRGLVKVWVRASASNELTESEAAHKVLTTLTDNDFFGEQTLLKTITAHNSKGGRVEAEEPVRASATCQCVSYCDMFRLTSEQFMVVLEQARTRRGSLMGKDAAGVLKNAVNERNTRADRLRKRSLLWAAAAQQRVKNSKEAAAKKEGNLTSQSGGIGMGAGSRLRAIVAARQRQESAERECFAAPSLSSIPDESQLPESTSGGIAQPKGSSCSDEGHLQSCAVPPSPTHSHPRQSLLSAARGCVPGFLPPTPSAMLAPPLTSAASSPQDSSSSLESTLEQCPPLASNQLPVRERGQSGRRDTSSLNA